MKVYLLTFFLLAALTAEANNDSLTNKTWVCEESFAGHQYVFYLTGNGKLKTIKQIHGSGVCVVKSEIYDVETAGDSVILKNGLDLNTGEPTRSPNLLFEQIHSRLLVNNKVVTHVSNESRIFNWATDTSCDFVDCSRLIKIKLKENEVYHLEEIREIRLEDE